MSEASSTGGGVGDWNPSPRSNWKRGLQMVTAVRRASVAMSEPEVGSLMRRMSSIDNKHRGTFLKVCSFKKIHICN